MECNGFRRNCTECTRSTMKPTTCRSATIQTTWGYYSKEEKPGWESNLRRMVLPIVCWRIVAFRCF